MKRDEGVKKILQGTRANKNKSTLHTYILLLTIKRAYTKHTRTHAQAHQLTNAHTYTNTHHTHITHLHPSHPSHSHIPASGS